MSSHSGPHPSQVASNHPAGSAGDFANAGAAILAPGESHSSPVVPEIIPSQAKSSSVGEGNLVRLSTVGHSTSETTNIPNVASEHPASIDSRVIGPVQHSRDVDIERPPAVGSARLIEDKAPSTFPTIVNPENHFTLPNVGDLQPAETSESPHRRSTSLSVVPKSLSPAALVAAGHGRDAVPVKVDPTTTVGLEKYPHLAIGDLPEVEQNVPSTVVAGSAASTNDIPEPETSSSAAIGIHESVYLDTPDISDVEKHPSLAVLPIIVDFIRDSPAVGVDCPTVGTEKSLRSGVVHMLPAEGGDSPSTVPIVVNCLDDAHDRWVSRPDGALTGGLSHAVNMGMLNEDEKCPPRTVPVVAHSPSPALGGVTTAWNDDSPTNVLVINEGHPPPAVSNGISTAQNTSVDPSFQPVPPDRLRLWSIHGTRVESPKKKGKKCSRLDHVPSVNGVSENDITGIEHVAAVGGPYRYTPAVGLSHSITNYPPYQGGVTSSCPGMVRSSSFEEKHAVYGLDWSVSKLRLSPIPGQYYEHEPATIGNGSALPAGMEVESDATEDPKLHGIFKAPAIAMPAVRHPLTVALEAKYLPYEAEDQFRLEEYASFEARSSDRQVSSLGIGDAQHPAAVPSSPCPPTALGYPCIVPDTPLYGWGDEYYLPLAGYEEPGFNLSSGFREIEKWLERANSGTGNPFIAPRTAYTPPAMTPVDNSKDQATEAADDEQSTASDPVTILGPNDGYSPMCVASSLPLAGNVHQEAKAPAARRVGRELVVESSLPAVRTPQGLTESGGSMSAASTANACRVVSVRNSVMVPSQPSLRKGSQLSRTTRLTGTALGRAKTTLVSSVTKKNSTPGIAGKTPPPPTAIAAGAGTTTTTTWATIIGGNDIPRGIARLDSAKSIPTPKTSKKTEKSNITDGKVQSTNVEKRIQHTADLEGYTSVPSRWSNEAQNGQPMFCNRSRHLQQSGNVSGEGCECCSDSAERPAGIRTLRHTGPGIDAVALRAALGVEEAARKAANPFKSLGPVMEYFKNEKMMADQVRGAIDQAEQSAGTKEAAMATGLDGEQKVAKITRGLRRMPGRHFERKLEWK